MIEYIREAFASGYLGAQGPLPFDEAAHAHCHTLCQFLPEHAEDLGTIRFAEAAGAQRALLTNLFLRRDRLTNIYMPEARIWSKRMGLHLDLGLVLSKLETAFSHGTTEAEAKATQTQKNAVKAAVIIALLAVLRENPDIATQGRTLAALSAAEGSAEGIASANAFVSTASVDLDAISKEALTQLKKLDTYWSGADATVSAQVAGLAGDLGPTLANMLAAGAGRATLEKAVKAILGMGDGAAFYLDEAIHTAYAQAQLAYYKRQGMTKVDYTTVADSRVCPLCEDIATGNPYTINTVPVPPEHGACRCWLTPVGST